jgi:glycosyltransferase involved in cell wall biosynthesis
LSIINKKSEDYKGKSVAFIGSVGIPNCYGGFEAFAESVTPVIARNGGRVTVTCDSSRYKNREPLYEGVHREFIGISANGWLSPVHDLYAYFRTFRSHDAVVVLGVSAGPFFLIMRVLAFLFGKALIINVDGVEWRRSKFSRFVRWVLRIFDFCAQMSATKIIYDNEALKKYILSSCRAKSVCIAYSGDHVLRFHDVVKCDFALTICRIEPENNLEILMEAVMASKLKKYVIIGNWNNSVFGRSLKKKYSHDRLVLLDPIYDSAEIGKYRESCALYLHGHSVGGTNPSLVEMLYYDCALFCYDCAFNRETAQLDSKYFNSAAELAVLIDSELDFPTQGEKPSRLKYTAEKIAADYMSCF